ncbi:MAG: hypothetical protein J6W23_10575 [Victivallales bacterium]|nr:hypothetical protein [Victivallales bacterium]
MAAVCSAFVKALRAGKRKSCKKTLRKSKKVNNSGRDFIGSSQDASSLWPDDVNALYLL